MVEALSYTYTTQAEVERVFSTQGALSRTADRGIEDEPGVWDDVVRDATDEINMYVEDWYDPVDLYNNSKVRRWAAWIGAWFLSQRRGNPPVFQLQYDNIMKMLELIQKGKMRIPRLPFRSDLSPAMSNLRIDDRFQVNKVRVQRSISTGGSGSLQDIDRDPILE